MVTSIKLNPIGLLSRLVNNHSSGCLELNDETVSWKIYLQQGNLNYVFCSVQVLDQLKYYLQYLQFKQAIAALKKLPPDYLTNESDTQEKYNEQNLYSKVISWLITEQHINPSQGLQLIEYITKDALQYCIWLNNKGVYLWHNQEQAPFWIREQFNKSLSLNLAKCLSLEQTRLKQWQSCSPKLLSVHQRPYFSPAWEQKPLPASGSLSHKTLKTLSQALKGSTSIRQLSLLLQKDELYVAQVLSPYIDGEIIVLRDAQTPLTKLPNIPRIKPISLHSPPVNAQKVKNAGVKIWKIVCIDDSPTVLQEIKRFLARDRFEVTVIDDPVQSVSLIFRIKPDLILLDITMPRINGYKLCSLLRGSEPYHHTPIIMVTGNTGLIDKARAKLAGATDYLTKPFNQQELMKLIEKHLK